MVHKVQVSEKYVQTTRFDTKYLVQFGRKLNEKLAEVFLVLVGREI